MSYDKVRIITDGEPINIPTEQLMYLGENDDLGGIVRRYHSEGDALDNMALRLPDHCDWILGEYNGIKVLVPYKPE